MLSLPVLDRLPDLFCRLLERLSETLCRADGVDTIYVDVWTSTIPAGTFTPPAIWAKMQPPNLRVWRMTSALGFGLNITYLNATQYKVCLVDWARCWDSKP